MGDDIRLRLPPKPVADVVSLNGRRQLTPTALRKAKASVGFRAERFAKYDTSVSHSDKIYKALSAYISHLQRQGQVANFGMWLSNSEEVPSEIEFWNRAATLTLGKTAIDITLVSSPLSRHRDEADGEYVMRKLQQTVMRLVTADKTYWVYAGMLRGVPQITDPRRWQVFSGPGEKPTIESFDDFITRHGPKASKTATPTAVAQQHDNTIRGSTLGELRTRRDGRFLQVVAAADAPTSPPASAAVDDKRPAKRAKVSASSVAAITTGKKQPSAKARKTAAKKVVRVKKQQTARKRQPRRSTPKTARNAKRTPRRS